MHRTLALAALVAALAIPAAAQETALAVAEPEPASAPIPLPVQRQRTGNAVLPANTEVLVQMNQDLSTKGRSWSEGDTFNMSVVHDVTLGDYVIIPRGSKAVGRITWLTSKGMFGKSGKMDIEVEYVEVAGRRIQLNGTYRQEGEGNTLATVGGVVFTTVGGFFITGKSALIPQGRELMTTTETDVELAIPASAIRAVPTKQAPLAASATVADMPASDTIANIEAAADAEANMEATASMMDDSDTPKPQGE